MFMREIETARLRLRTWREDDLAPYARICADPEVMRYLSGPMTRQHSEEQVSKFVRHWEERGFGLWAVAEKSSSVFIGFLGRHHLGRVPACGHLGYSQSDVV